MILYGAERTDLAIAILRSNDVKVSQLEISTAVSYQTVRSSDTSFDTDPKFVPVAMPCVLGKSGVYRAREDERAARDIPGRKGRRANEGTERRYDIFIACQTTPRLIRRRSLFPYKATSDIVISVSNSPPPSLAKPSRASSFKSIGTTTVKSEYPATLPRANLRALNMPFTSSPIASASGSSSTIASSHSASFERNGSVSTANLSVAPGAPALKKRKLTQKTSLSLDDRRVAADQENVDPLTALGLQMPTPTKAPGTNKRVRSSKNPGPIAIGTVQLDDHRPNTTLGVRTGFQSRDNLMSLAPSPISGNSMGVPQWQSNNWSMEHGMMATGVPVVINNVASPYSVYPMHGQPNGSASTQGFHNSPNTERIHSGSWLLPSNPTPQPLQHPIGNASFPESHNSISSGRPVAGRSSQSISNKESRRVLGETRSASNQVSLTDSSTQDAFSHGFAISQIPTTNQLGFAFFDEQQSRQHQNHPTQYQPSNIAADGSYSGLRPRPARLGRRSSSDCIS